jgi:hypothetical protein
MKFIYVDDLRPTPAGNIYDEHFKTVNDTLKYVRAAYKAGTTTFFLDLNNIEILNELETLHDSGKMRHLKLKVHFHSDIYSTIIKRNHKWMEEV